MLSLLMMDGWMESDGDMRDIKGRVSHNIWWENSSDLKMVKKTNKKAHF